MLAWRRRQWHPTPVLLPRKSHGRRSLVGCSPWDLQMRKLKLRSSFDTSQLGKSRVKSQIQNFLLLIHSALQVLFQWTNEQGSSLSLLFQHQGFLFSLLASAPPICLCTTVCEYKMHTYRHVINHTNLQPNTYRHTIKLPKQQKKHKEKKLKTKEITTYFVLFLLSH